MSSSETLPEDKRRRLSGGSIATRLTIWYAASAFVLVAMATGLLYWVLATNVDQDDDRFLVDTIEIVRALIRERPNDLSALEQEVQWEGATRRYARVFIRVLDPDDRLIIETSGASAIFEGHPMTPARADMDPGPGIDTVSPEGVPYRILSAWAPVGPGGTDERLVQIALDRGGEYELLARYRARLWIVLGLALLAAAAVGHLIAQRGMRPVGAITATAQGIGSSTLDKRIPIAGLPSELSTLADTFNRMMDRLEEAFGRLTSLSVDLAHELRTPVNNLRGEVEVALGKPRTAGAYRETLESLLEESVGLSEMIDALMFLARAENPETQIVRTAIGIPRELREASEFYEPAASEAGVALGVSVPDEPFLASVDRTLFQRALSNLMTNAITHTPAGGRIQLRATCTGSTLVLQVADTGTGIPAEHVARVSDRFYRADASRSGTSGGLGLGLAIVKSVMNVHGGSMKIHSEPGGGTTVELRFPEAVLRRAASAETRAAAE